MKQISQTSDSEIATGKAAPGKLAPRAMFDVMGGDRDRNNRDRLVDAIPPGRFGTGKGRILRKIVLLAIAKNADPDGTNAYPSRETIAHRCLVTVRAVDRAIAWLVTHELLKVESKAKATSKLGRTNRYTILFGQPQETVGTFQQPAEVDGPAVEHPEMPVLGADESPGTTGAARGTTEPARRTTGSDTKNNVSEDGEQLEQAPGTSITPDRPIDRPLDRPFEPPERTKEKTNEQPDSFSTSIPAGPSESERMAEEYRTFLEDHAGEWPPPAFVPSDADAWKRHRRERSARRDEYLKVLVGGRWPDLNLTKNEKKDITDCFLTTDYKMSILKVATETILGDLDVTSSFDHAGSKLATNLADKCAAIVAEFARRERVEKLMERVTEQARLKREAEDAARLAARADENTDAF